MIPKIEIEAPRGSIAPFIFKWSVVCAIVCVNGIVVIVMNICLGYELLWWCTSIKISEVDLDLQSGR